MFKFPRIIFCVLLLIYRESLGLVNCPGEDELPKISSANPPATSTIKSYYANYGVGLSQQNKAINQLSFDCKAGYPIEWIFEGNQPTWAKVKTRVTTKSYFNNSSPCYTATLNPPTIVTQVLSIFTKIHELVQVGKTGNYTCRSIADPSKSSSVYKFVYDEKEGNLFNTKSKVNLTLSKPENNEYVIPCPANSEDLQVSLIKIDQVCKQYDFSCSIGTNGAETNLSTKTSSIRFDPKIGFLSRIKPSGSYKCHGELKTRSEDVFVSFKGSTEFRVNPTDEYVNFDNGVLTLTCESDEEITFDISGMQTTEVEHAQTFLKSSKYTFVIKFVAKTRVNNTKGAISCVSKQQTSRVLHTWRYDLNKGCNCTWEIVTGDRDSHNRLMRFYNEDMRFLYSVTTGAYYGRFLCNNSQGYETSSTFLPCGNPIECGIMAPGIKEDGFHLIEKGGFDEQAAAAVITSQVSSGVLKCTVDNFSQIRRVYGGIVGMNFEQPIPAKQQMHLRAAEEHLFLGDTMLFTCQVVSYLFSRELKWALGYKNGSISYLEIKAKNDTMGGDKLRIYRTSYITIADRNAESIYCFAPLWNSTEWRNISKPLLIESYEPFKNTSGSTTFLTGKQKSEIILYRFSDPATKKLRVPHKVTDTTVIIRYPVRSVKLSCISRFPIEWRFEGKSINSTSKFIRENRQKVPSEIAGTDSTPSLSFRSTIEIVTNVTDGTGNYTCTKMHGPDLILSSVYIFASGDGANPIIKHGQHQNIPVKSTESWVILPCRVSEPAAIVHLYQQDDSGEYHQLIPSDSVKYDPKLGFLLQASSSLISSLPQFFACSTAVNDTGHGLSFSLLPVDWEEQVRLAAQQGTNKSLYSVIIVFIMLTILLGLTVFYLWRELKIQKQFIQGSMGAGTGTQLSQDRQPVVHLDELAGRNNVNGGPPYDAL